MNYVISSAEKALKYVNMSNIEAEFAVKLFKSDKENLLSDLQHFNLDELLQHARMSATNDAASKSPGRFSGAETAVLKSENIELRKKIMLMEAENARLN